MRAVVQRVAGAEVKVGADIIAGIDSGLLIYLGVAPTDSPEVAHHLAARLAQLRIFPDAEGRMNLSLLDCRGQALVVSQFTLFADNRRGHRPAFTAAGQPEQARRLCQLFGEELRRLGVSRVSEGRFGAHMVVSSANDGPVTIVASSAEEPWPADCG
ncbi:MAG: D-aminoacyl-tRNA deacylase [Candidatus Dormiibacterota bacterium]